MEELRTLKTSLSTNRILVRIITPISTKLICRDTAAICSGVMSTDGRREKRYVKRWETRSGYERPASDERDRNGAKTLKIDCNENFSTGFGSCV